jgi:long-chain acyl-CoA synthetase
MKSEAQFAKPIGVEKTVTPFRALMHQARYRPENTAFIFHDEVWTYRRLADEAERVADGLVANGVEAGDRVALHMLNRPEILVAYYACLRLGAIAAPLRTAFTFAELEPMLQRLKPALYIGAADLYWNVVAVDARLLGPQKRFTVDAVDQKEPLQFWDVLKQAPQVDLPTPPSHEPAVLINTSGTTGQPKFVAHTPDTLAATTDLLCRDFGLADDDVAVVPMSMAHISGFILSLTFIHCGIPFIVMENFDAGAVLDNVERHKVTRLIGFPYQYAALLEAQQARPRNLSSVRICLTGADVCPTDLQEKVTSAFGAPLYNLWGASEVVGSLTFGLKIGPVSRIVEGAQVRLIDDTGADVPRGEIGELLIRGPNVFAGYWNDRAATEESLKAGWYYTGDLLRRGDDNDLWFVSRKKDIIIRGGTNISPIEVEEALVASHPAVAEAAVVGKRDDVLGQRVFGFVKLAPGAKKTVVTEVLQNVAQRLAPYKVPEALRVVDALPRNALSKVDRKMLQTMIREDETALSPSTSASSRIPRTHQARSRCSARLSSRRRQTKQTVSTIDP